MEKLIFWENVATAIYILFPIGCIILFLNVAGDVNHDDIGHYWRKLWEKIKRKVNEFIDEQNADRGPYSDINYDPAIHGPVIINNTTTMKYESDEFQNFQHIETEEHTRYTPEERAQILNEEMYYGWFGGDRTKGENMVGNTDFLSEGLEGQTTTTDRPVIQTEEKPQTQIIAENIQIIQNSPHKFESWGLECPVVLIEKTSSEYQAWCVATEPMTHLKTWHIKSFTDMFEIRRILTKWNYDLRICPCKEDAGKDITEYKPLKRKLDV